MAHLHMTEDQRHYHLSEILGCATELEAMPCDSLRARLLAAVDKAVACEKAAERAAVSGTATQEQTP